MFTPFFLVSVLLPDDLIPNKDGGGNEPVSDAPDTAVEHALPPEIHDPSSLPPVEKLSSDVEKM